MNKQFTKMNLLLGALLAGSSMASAQWEPCNGPFGGPMEQVIVSSGHVIVAKSLNGDIFSSSDEGQSWNLLPKLPQSMTPQDILFNADDSLVVSTSAGYYTQNGNAWIKHDINSVDEALDKMVIRGTVYMTVTAPGWVDQGSLFVSKNSGASWEQVTVFPSWVPINDIRIDANASGDLICYAMLGTGIYRSLDSGDTWTEISQGLNPDKNNKELAVTDNDLFILTDDTIYRTSKTTINWEPTRAIPVAEGSFVVPSGIKYINGKVVVITSYGKGSFGYNHTTGDWEPMTGFDATIEWNAISSDGGKLWGATSSGITFSADTGKTWTMKNDGLRITNISHIDIAGESQVISTTSDLFYSNDNGATFTTVSPSFYNKRYIMSANMGDQKLVLTNTDCFLGTPSGTSYTWEKITDTAYSSTGWIEYAAVFSEHSRIWIATSDSLIMSADSGATWQHVSNEEGTLKDVLLLFGRGDSVIAITRSGNVFSTEDNGQHWTEIDTEIDDFSSVTSIYYDGLNYYFGSNNMKNVFRASGQLTNWEEFNTGLPEGGFGNYLTGSGDTLVIVTAGDLYIRRASGGRWHQIDGPENADLSTLCFDAGYLYGGTYNASLWKIGRDELEIPTTGIGEDAEEATLQVSVFPNPVSHSFRIESREHAIDNSSVGLYDVMGRKVLEQQKYHSPEAIDITPLPAGVYHVVIHNAQGTFQARLVKN